MALAVVLLASLAMAVRAADPAIYITGCLDDRGRLYNVALGTGPREPCRGTDTAVTWSNGDITGVLTGPGLTGGGGSGEVTVEILAGGVVEGMLATDAVTSDKIRDGSVTTADLSDRVVSVPKIATAAAPLAGDVLAFDGSDLTWLRVGDISAVIAGDGLTGGATTGDASLAVDSTFVQRRVSGTCVVGSAIVAINLDGSVVCGTLRVQRYQAVGTGLETPPAAVWTDVPGAAISRDFSPGVWKASFTATQVLSGANGTMYVRLMVRHPSGQEDEAMFVTTQRFQSAFSEGNRDITPFVLQALINLPGGQATIVPQMWSNYIYSALSSPVLILEQ